MRPVPLHPLPLLLLQGQSGAAVLLARSTRAVRLLVLRPQQPFEQVAGGGEDTLSLRLKQRLHCVLKLRHLREHRPVRLLVLREPVPRCLCTKSSARDKSHCRSINLPQGLSAQQGRLSAPPKRWRRTASPKTAEERRRLQFSDPLLARAVEAQPALPLLQPLTLRTRFGRIPGCRLAKTFSGAPKGPA